MPQDRRYGSSPENLSRGYMRSQKGYGQNRSEERFTATFKFTRVSAPVVQDNKRVDAGSSGAYKKPSSSQSIQRKKGRADASANTARGNSLPVPVRGAPTQKRRDLSVRNSAKDTTVKNRDESGVSLIRKRLVASRMPKMHTVNARVIRRFPLRLIFLAIFCTLLFMTIIYNNVQINEKESEIVKIEDQISDIDEKITQTALEVEKKNDLREIEQRALELGMVKADQLEKEYVSIMPSDKIELISDENEDNREFHMTGIFETIRQRIADFIESIR